MFTAEEFENFDIFPKKFTYKFIFKSIFYIGLWTFGFILLFSFYSERDFSEIISGDFIQYKDDNFDTLINRLVNIEPKKYYLDLNKLHLNYSDGISEFFIKNYVIDSYPCIIKNGSLGFNIFNTSKYLIDKLNKINESTLKIENRLDPYTEFFHKEFKSIRTNYTDFINNKMKDNTSIYILNELDIISVFIEDLTYKKLTKRIFSNLIKNPLLNNYLLNQGIFFSEGNSFINIGGHSEKTENFICLLKGHLDLILIPPLEIKYVYPYKEQFGPVNYSPINFFINSSKSFPNFQKANKILINISKGDCLYIPSYWWRSLKTENKHYQFLTLKYKEPSIYFSELIE